MEEIEFMEQTRDISWEATLIEGADASSTHFKRSGGSGIGMRSLLPAGPPRLVTKL